MDQDKYIQETHDYLLDFLAQTAANEEQITVSIKSTIRQFLHNTRVRIALCAQENGGTWVSSEQIITAQIAELRQCITDLQSVLTQGASIQ